MPISCVKCGHNNPITDSSCSNCKTLLENLDIRLELANMDIRLGRIKEGIQLLKDVTEIYMTKGKLRRVERILQNLQGIQPDDIDIPYFKGQINLSKGNYDLAEKEFRKILVKDISNVKALVKLGETCDKKGDNKSADVAFRKVMKIEPNRPEPYEFLAKLELDNGNKKEAANYYNQASELYKEIGNEDKSSELLNRFYELSGKNTTVVEEERDDNVPPPEEEDLIGLHLPGIELSFGDEEDPFAPSFKDPITPLPLLDIETKMGVKQVEEEKVPEKKEEEKKVEVTEIEKEDDIDRTEIFLAILNEHPDHNKRLLAILNLDPKAGENVVKSLVEALKDQNRGVRTQAAITLANGGDKMGIGNLVEALEKDEDPAIRETAASLLGQLGDKRALDILIKALKDKDTAVSITAAISLGKINDPSIVAPLIEYMNTADGVTLNKIIEILAHTGDRTILKPFIDVFDKNDSTELRLNIISIIKDYDDPLLLDFFVRILLDKNKEIKISAINMIGKLGNKKTIRHIEPYLTEKDPDIVKAAEETLDKLGYKPSVLSKLKAFFYKKR